VLSSGRADRLYPYNLILRKHMQTFFRKSLIVSGLALGAAVIGQNAIAGSGDTLRWQSVIGIAQANNVVGSGTGAVTGGGAPWSTLDGHVNVVLENGELNFDVRGLVLAGGNSVLVDTPLVELSDEGNARFDGSVGPLPSVCASEPDVAFLIRVGSGRWIANGSVLR
jgi:hypothetical protein